ATQAQGELRAKMGHEPSAAEIATEVGASESDVALALDAASASQAVELPESAETGERTLDTTDDRLFLSEAFRGLDERERRIMYLRYIRDAEPDAVAAELGISRRQLARSTEEALKKLRVGLESPGRQPVAPASSRAAPRPSPEPSDHKMPPASPSEHRHPIDQPYHIELVKSAA